jgi:formate hydrogenlyase transcriptional activator
VASTKVKRKYCESGALPTSINTTMRLSLHLVDLLLARLRHGNRGQKSSGMVEEGSFRGELYYGLYIFPIEAPPLRNRPQDIPLLTWHFVRKYALRMKKRIESILPEDMEALVRYLWPGNVRELQNIIERSVILWAAAVLHRPALAELKRADKDAQHQVRTLAEAEREHILQTLRETEWVIGGPEGATAQLELIRTTLIYKMRRLGIFRPLPCVAKL